MWLSDLTVVLPDTVLPRASIRMEAREIAEIQEGPAPVRGSIDGRGLMALPGLIDLHGDMIERELEPRPNSFLPTPIALYELDKRLAATGITTAYAAISFAAFSLVDDAGGGTQAAIPNISNSNKTKPSKLRVEESAKALVLELNQLRPTLLTDLRIHARFEVTYSRAEPVLLELIEQEQVHMVSLMDHTPGQGQFRNIESYVRYMTHWLKVEQKTVERALNVLLETPPASQTLHSVSSLCHQHGIVLASHDDDTAAKVQLMAELKTSLSEFPITVEAAQAAHAAGMWVAMGAPNALRGGSHSGNASALEILQAGALDILMTDYYPAAMLHAALGWVDQAIISLPQAVRLIATHPAACARLDDRGVIEVGKRADLVLIQPKPVPRVVATLRNGNFIYRADLPPSLR